MITKTVRIAASELGLLFRDGMFEMVLGPGRHKILRWRYRPVVHKIDLRPLHRR